MRIATMRRHGGVFPGVSGVARLDRRTARLASRLNAGDIAVIDHVDLDRVSAEALVAARPAAVLNAQPSISGRYPNLGPELLVASGILLVDNVGPEIFAAVKEGTKIRIDGDTVFVGETPVVQGTAQDAGTIASLMVGANTGLTAQLEAFARNTSEHMARERDLLLDGAGLPAIRTQLAGRHVMVVVRGYDYTDDIKALKHYIREYKPVLVAIDGGADALIEAGYRPDIIVGDMDAVSDSALRCGAEVVVRAHQDGRAPGLPRVQDLGIDAICVPTTSTSEDIALLLADHNGAELIVTVGTPATLHEFLDKGRGGMASSFLTRLKVGGKLVDADGVKRLYRNRISGAALLLLAVAAVIAIVAALAVSDTSHGFVHNVGTWWDDAIDWVKGLFS